MNDRSNHDPPAKPSPPATEAQRPGALRRYTLPSLAVAGGMIALERLRSGYQARRMFAPADLDPGTEPRSIGLPAEDQWLTSEDGVRLNGWWIPHPRPRATLLFCHGNTGNLGTYLAVFRYLRRLRVSIFGFDYRGYGHSEGRPSEQGLYRDARAAWNHLTGTLGVDPETIAVFGHSLGGAVGIELAGQRPVPALVIQSSFTDIRTMARERFSPAHLIARNSFRSIDKVGALTMPKLFIHGEEDERIPISIGHALFRAAAEPKAWYSVKGAHHNDLHRLGRQAYLRTLRRFLSRALH